MTSRHNDKRLEGIRRGVIVKNLLIRGEGGNFQGLYSTEESSGPGAKQKKVSSFSKASITEKT